MTAAATRSGLAAIGGRVQFAPQHPVPVFPLPQAVLFPRVILPLHVFELRYRTMVRDALSRERLLALALLRPGWETDYYGNPPFFTIGCLARFEEVVWLPNDCYDLKVRGLSRVRIQRLVREYPYRAATVAMHPEEPFTESDPLIQLERHALHDAYTRLTAKLGEAAGLPALEEAMPFEPLVNSVATVVVADAGEKLQLLELDSVLERAQHVRARVEAALRGTGRGT